MKTISVGVDDSARDVVASALATLDIANNNSNNSNNNNSSSSSPEYQLWVKTKADESPYPLIGHEIPLVIKLHWTRCVSRILF